MLQNLRIGLKKRRNGKSDVPEAAWRLAKKILKFKEKHKTTFFSPSENWCVPAPSTIKPEEREFVVDSGASMHMISKKDLNSAELETVTTSRSPTTVITATGEVQTNEEATQICRSESFAMNMDTHLSLSTSTSMTPLRQKIDHSESSSSSSTSTPTTPSKETDQSDHPPAIVSSESVDRQVETPQELLHEPTKNPKPEKTKTTSWNGETRFVPKSRNGCKNSERILWMKEFLNTEIRTRVLLMNHL